MRNKLFKLLVVGVFVFLGFEIKVDAQQSFHQAYLNNSSLSELPMYMEQATLKISGVFSDELFKAYKILDVYYNSETNEMLYGFTEDFYNFLYEMDLGITSDTPFTVDDYFALTSGDITSGSTVSTSELDTLVSNYSIYIKENSIEGIDMIFNKPVASLTAEAGSYLILPTQTNRVFAVMVGNLDMYADGTEWKVNDETIVAKVSNVSILRDNCRTSKNRCYFYDTFVDREYISVIEIFGPTYPTNATNKKFSIEDTLDSGITFGGINSVELEAAGVIYTNNNGIFTDNDGNIVATASFVDQVLRVDFNVDYLDSMTIIVSYVAKLNENAVIGFEANKDTVVLFYSNDPYGDGVTSTEAWFGMGTYGLQIYKYDLEDNSPLSGVVFEIYTDKELTDLIGTITTDENGIGKFKGITMDTLYLKEVKAPTGYKLLRDYITLSSLVPGSIEDEISIEVPEGYRMEYIANEKMGLLPVTGGIGTVIFTLICLAIIVCSISFITIYKARKNNENFQV